jgi:hypothetical protein
MKMKYVLLAAVVVTIFFACQKEPDPNLLGGGSSNSCQLIKAVFYDSVGAVDDTLGFVYTGTQVTRVNYVSYFVKLDYTNGKISKRSFYDYAKPDSAYYFDQFSYNSDGTLSVEQDYAFIAGIPTPFLYGSYTYTYSGGKLSQMVTKYDTSGTGVLAAVYQSNYAYIGNNISKSINKELVGNSADTLTYSFDSKPNYYLKNPFLFYTDDLFAGGVPGELLPLALSANNATGVLYGGFNTNITYITDSKQNFTELDINGNKSATYSYKCQ